MPEFPLEPRTPLAGYAREFGGVRLKEVTDLSLVSLAVPSGGAGRLARVLDGAFGIGIPEVGHTAFSPGEKLYVLRLQNDQLFLAFEYSGDAAVAAVAGRLGDAGYYTEQTDSWAMLRIEGTGCRRALRRICMLDLEPGVFPCGAVSRTTMEHIGVIIMHEAPESFLLLAQRSYAESFLHALETSITNTL